MTQASIFSLILLCITLGAQLFARPRATGATTRASPFLVHLRWLTFIALSGLFAWFTYESTAQYFAWANGGAISPLLLPPYNSIHYFLFYAFTEFWANGLLATTLGIISYFIIRRYAENEQPFFYPEEPLLCLLTISLVGHPFWIVYLLSLLITALIGTLITRFITHTNSRVSFRYLWLPLAIGTLSLSPILSKLGFVIYLRF